MEPENTPNVDPQDAKQRLLEAAERVFAEKGYDSATVREICRAADVNIASINYYFGDKERLYVETLKRAHACADGASYGEPVLQWPEGTPPVQKLRDFIRNMALRMHTPARPTAMRLLMREMADLSPTAKQVIFGFFQPKASALCGILNELMPNTDARQIMMTAFSVIGQITFYRQNRPVAELIFGKDTMNSLDAEMVADHITRFTMRALGIEGERPA